MQCPACSHEAPQIEFGDPLRCPDCGAFYEKALALKLRREYLASPTEPTDPPVQAAQKPIKKRTAWPFFVIPITIFTVVVVLNTAPDPANSRAADPSKEPVAVVASDPPHTALVQPEIKVPSADESALSMTQLEFRGVKDGGLLYVDFTVINNGSQQIKDIEIECVHNGKSGSRIDSNTRTIYDVVGPRSRKTFKRFSMGIIHSQATQTRCLIRGLKV